MTRIWLVLERRNLTHLTLDKLSLIRLNLQSLTLEELILKRLVLKNLTLGLTLKSLSLKWWLYIWYTRLYHRYLQYRLNDKNILIRRFLRNGLSSWLHRYLRSDWNNYLWYSWDGNFKRTLNWIFNRCFQNRLNHSLWRTGDMRLEWLLNMCWWVTIDRLLDLNRNTLNRNFLNRLLNRLNNLIN